ncbi:hypothetical protein WSK_4069, partial [Novosphingobium sp. Rr 2-17]
TLAMTRGWYGTRWCRTGCYRTRWYRTTGCGDTVGRRRRVRGRLVLRGWGVRGYNTERGQQAPNLDITNHIGYKPQHPIGPMYNGCAVSSGRRHGLVRVLSSRATHHASDRMRFTPSDLPHMTFGLKRECRGITGPPSRRGVRARSADRTAFDQGRAGLLLPSTRPFARRQKPGAPSRASRRRPDGYFRSRDFPWRYPAFASGAIPASRRGAITLLVRWHPVRPTTPQRWRPTGRASLRVGIAHRQPTPSAHWEWPSA